MKFIDNIFSFVWDVSDWLYARYVDVPNLSWLTAWIKTPLLWLSDRVFDLLTPIAHLGDWVSNISTLVADILNWANIKSLILGWLPDLTDIISWFQARVAWLTTHITIWWSSIITDVKGWIGIATQGLPGLLVAWNNFWTLTFPTLISSTGLAQWWQSRLLDIDTLLNSAFTTRQSLWSGWLDYRAHVAEFFTDPLEFIWSKFTDWFLGPEVKP